jgi:hypothetical protein
MFHEMYTRPVLANRICSLCTWDPRVAMGQKLIGFCRQIWWGLVGACCYLISFRLGQFVRLASPKKSFIFVCVREFRVCGISSWVLRKSPKYKYTALQKFVNTKIITHLQVEHQHPVYSLSVQPDLIPNWKSASPYGSKSTFRCNLAGNVQFLIVVDYWIYFCRKNLI